MVKEIGPNLEKINLAKSDSEYLEMENRVYPRDMSFVDRQGKLVHPTKEEFNSKRKNYGEAYGFFKCNASNEEIKEYMPTILELAQTPSELELSLIEGIDKVDSSLTHLVSKLGKESQSSTVELANLLNKFGDEIKKLGINYVFQAKYPHATNVQTANELADILNQTYNSPLYKTREKFFGEIIYKDKGRYVFRD